MFSVATQVFMVSILALPISYAMNQLIQWMQFNDLVISLLSFMTIFIISLIILLCVSRDQSRAHKPSNKRHEAIHFFIFSTFAFTSVISLIAGLELDGLISGFMNAFLKYGEPYLRSSHGVMICYWNGTAVYAMYLMMIAAITWANDFYDVSLYWFGSIVNSMLVLLLSIVNGKYGLNWCLLLYIPYMIAPPIIIHKIHKCRQSSVSTVYLHKLRPIYTRFTDILLVLYLILSISIALLRGIAVLHQNEINICVNYLKYIEPYLTVKSPAPFGKMQMIIYLFYFIPIYMASIYALISPHCSQWIHSLSLIHAGAAVQAQITHIGSSFHSRTPYIQRVPQELSVQFIFWTINLTLLIGPQLLSIRCFNVYDFSKTDTTDEVSKIKSQKSFKSD